MPVSSTASRTDVGRLRKHNEDALTVLPDLGIFCVADGMGGLAHGEVASSTAITVVETARAALTEIVRAVEADPRRPARANLGTALEQLSDIASHRIQQVLEGANSGTTMVLGAIAGGHLLVANTGDSRAYLYRSGELRCLTDDHTVAAAKLRAGEFTQEEHDESPYQHMLYQALGTQGEVNPDLFDEPLADGDLVLLCSDGLTGPVADRDVADLCAKHQNLDDLAGALIDTANLGGGPDNITVVLARYEGGPSAADLERDREMLRSHPATALLEDIDQRLLRHFLDFVALDDGGKTDPDAGAHLVLTGTLVRGDERAEAGDFIALRGLVGDAPAAWTAEGPVTALTLTADACAALEARRPRVAARLFRGLLTVAVRS